MPSAGLSWDHSLATTILQLFTCMSPLAFSCSRKVASICDVGDRVFMPHGRLAVQAHEHGMCVVGSYFFMRAWLMFCGHHEPFPSPQPSPVSGVGPYKQLKLVMVLRRFSKGLMAARRRRSGPSSIQVITDADPHSPTHCLMGRVLQPESLPTCILSSISSAPLRFRQPLSCLTSLLPPAPCP
jgi:hypothetical protein